MTYSANPDTARDDGAELEMALTQYGERLERRHAAYETTLDALDTFWETNQQIPSIEATQNVFKQRLEEKYADIQALATADPLDEAAMDDAVHDYAIILANLDSYQDMADVASGKKQFCDENGEPTSFANAAYVLKPEEKVVVEDSGVQYLVDKNVNLQDLSPQEKQSAQQAFEKAKPAITPMRELVAKKCAFEKDFYGACLNSARAENAGQSPQLTDNQERAVAAAQASVAAELRKGNPNVARLDALSEVRTSGSSRATRASRRAFNSAGSQLKQSLHDVPSPAAISQAQATADYRRGLANIIPIPSMPIPPFILMRLAKRPGNTLSVRQLDDMTPDVQPEQNPNKVPDKKPAVQPEQKSPEVSRDEPNEKPRELPGTIPRPRP